jgi:hypothetical protein
VIRSNNDGVAVFGCTALAAACGSLVPLSIAAAANGSGLFTTSPPDGSAGTDGIKASSVFVEGIADGISSVINFFLSS